MRRRWALRRADIALVAGLVLAFGTPGAALVAWAEARTHSDNQRNWAYIGGWVSLGVAGTVLVVSATAIVRNQGSRRIQVAFGVLASIAAMALLVAAASLGG